MPDSRPRQRIEGFGVSVRVRILATLLLVTAAGMVAAGGIAYLLQRERILSAVDDRLTSLVADAQSVATESSARTLDEAQTAIIQRLRPGANESSLAIIDGAAALSPGGSVDFRLDRNAALVARITRETAASGVVRGTFEPASAAGAPDFGTLRYIATPVTVSTDARTGVFVIAVDLDRELAPLTEAFTTYAVVAALALVIIALVGWFVAGRMLRPIRALTGAATRITGSDLRERIPVRGNDDVSALTTTVNGMLDRLEGAMDDQRRLLDDVGHELKTPLTIVRGHLELMDTDDPADVISSRDLAVNEVDRMSGLVQGLTELADSGRDHGLALSPVDVGKLTDRISAKARALADRDWIVISRAQLVAALDGDRLTQAMLQLAANAVTHGHSAVPVAQQRIELGSAVDPGGRELRLWVADAGPGIEPGAQARIFDRFQRGSGASGRGVAGSGLGLAIVANIAAAHGGRVEVESAAGAGARFTIVLPVRPAGLLATPPASTAAAPNREEQS